MTAETASTRVDMNAVKGRIMMAMDIMARGNAVCAVKSKGRTLAGCAAGALAFALVAAAPAMAQSNAAETAGASDKANAAETATPSDRVADIVVTAQFREQNLQDTPIAITALNAAMLEARSQTNIADVANQAPNVTLRAAGANNGPSIFASIRGVGQSDFNPALEPGVGMYVDDVYYPTLTGSLFDLLDLDRVEVLRGPQGTLAGKNSIGGAIKLYSRKPDGNGGGYIQATYGSRDRLDFRGSADFTIAPNLFGRISGVYKGQRGYVGRYDYGCLFPASGVPATQPAGSCKVDTQGDVGYAALRGMLRYAPHAGLDITLAADYTREDHRVPGVVLLNAGNSNPNVAVNGVPYDNRFLCGRYCNYTDFANPAATWLGPVAPGFPLIAMQADDRTTYEGWGVSANIKADLTDHLSFDSITAYRAYSTHWANDDSAAPTSLAFSENRLKHWFVSQELRLNGKIGDTINFTVGGFYSDQRTTYYTLQDIRYAPIPLQFVGNDPVNASTKAAFANVGWQATEALSFNGGVRYSKESKDYTFVRLDPATGLPNVFLGALNGLTGEYSGNRLDYRMAVDYRLSPAVLAYASVATGFKGGGIGPRPFLPQQVQSFGPEKLVAYEIGLKSDLFDRKLRLNLSAFFNQYKDIQLTFLSCPQFGGPGPCSLPQNAGDADVKGIELETTIRPTEGLMIDGAVSYLDFKYKCVNPAVVGLAPGSCSSDPALLAQLNPRSPYTPKWKWSVGVQYEIPLGSAGTLTPRFDASYQSAMYTAALPSPAAIQPLAIIDGYTLANARLSWKNANKDLEIALEVTNVFNKYYFLTKFDSSGPSGAGFTSGYPGRPREWAISVKKKF